MYPSVDASPSPLPLPLPPCDCEVTCRRVALRLRRPGIHHHRASAGGGREGAGELGQWRRRRAGGWRHQHTSFRLHACGRSVDQQGSAGEPPLFTSERGWERGTGRRGGGPTHTATHGQSRGSSTLFDAPKSTVPTHPRQLTDGIKALEADVI